MATKQKAKIIKPKKVEEKKKFSWGTIFYYLKALFSNERALEIGLKSKWYVWLPILFVFTLLSTVPQVVIVNNTAASTNFSQTTNDAYYVGLTEYVNDDTAKDITFNENGTATAEFTDATYYEPLYEFKFHNSQAGTETTLLQIYFVDSNINDYNSKINMIDQYSSITAPYDYEGTTTGLNVARTNSFILFTTNNVFFKDYRLGTTTVTANIGGDYLNLRSEYRGKTFKEVLRYTQTGYDNVSLMYLKNFYNLVDDSYQNNKVTAIWTYFGIMVGLNVGITVLMGLMFFILTRGKNNPYKSVMKWHQGFSIAAWISITPSLLSLIGFGFSTYAMLLYILFFGVRSMWLVMKYLRNTYQD